MKAIFLMFALFVVAGCMRDLPKDRPPLKLETNMYAQPRYETQSESRFFADGAAMRTAPGGTVARGFLAGDTAYFTGKDSQGQWIAKIPAQVTMELLKRGQERYGIYCSPCHSRLGDGQGMAAKRGMLPPATFHDERVRAIADGTIFDVITNGIRNMPGYRYQIPVADRWAIVSYFRALQRSHHATADDLTTDEQARIAR